MGIKESLTLLLSIQCSHGHRYKKNLKLDIPLIHINTVIESKMSIAISNEVVWE